jgi:hypothetical protein
MVSVLVVCALLLLHVCVLGAPSKYSYTNCGKASDPVVVVSSALTPSPILYTQNVTFATTVQVKRRLTSADAGKITVAVQKWALVSWVDIPCSVTGLCDTPTNFCDAINITETTCSVLKR